MRKRVIDGLKSYRVALLDRAGDNTVPIIKYIYARMQECTLKPSSRTNMIERLCYLSLYHDNKNFSSMDKDDIQQYLYSFDPIHPNFGKRLEKYSGSYKERKNNQERKFSIESYKQSVVRIQSFFSWLCQPLIPTKRRKLPDFLQDLDLRSDKHKDKFTPSDMWTWAEDKIFLKYCRSKKLKAFHAISRELAARGHEYLNLKIGNVIKEVDDEGKTFVLVHIGKDGKSNERQLPLTWSIPYLNEWLTAHTYGNNPDYYIFISENRRGKHENKATEVHSMYMLYQNEKKYFQELSHDNKIPSEDKQVLSTLLNKPWGNHIRRHIGLTDRAKAGKNSDFLRGLGGYSSRSHEMDRYKHLANDDVVNGLLIDAGYKIKGGPEQKKELDSVICSICREPNRHDSRFCHKCNFVFTDEAFYKWKEEKDKQTQEMEKRDKEIAELKQELSSVKPWMLNMEKRYNEMIAKGEITPPVVRRVKVKREDIERLDESLKNAKGQSFEITELYAED